MIIMKIICFNRQSLDWNFLSVLVKLALNLLQLILTLSSIHFFIIILHSYNHQAHNFRGTFKLDEYPKTLDCLNEKVLSAGVQASPLSHKIQRSELKPKLD